MDDEPEIGALLGRVLREHTVTAVTSASQALGLLEQGEAYDLIFCDLMMPEMSGMEFFERLTARFPESADRVVFISGGAFTTGAAAFLDQVTRPCLDKPFEAQVVRALVEDAIR